MKVASEGHPISQPEGVMPHCTKCGTEVDAAATYCQSCGERQPAGAAPVGAAHHAGSTEGAGAATAAAPGSAAGQSAAGPGARSGLAENVAGALCYALFWVSGLVFLLIDKRPYVQFHAAQSLVVFGALWLLRTVVGVVFFGGFALRDWDDWGGWGFGRWGGFEAGATLIALIKLAALVLWLLLMLKAYQGERFRVPIISDLADSIAGKFPASAQQN